MHRVLTICMFLMALGFQTLGQTEPLRAGANGPSPRQVRCYPNPATTSIFFEVKARNQQEFTQLRIFNFLGKKVVDVPRMSTSLRIDLNGFTRGIYIYQLTDAQGRVMESGKFHIEKP